MGDTPGRGNYPIRGVKAGAKRIAQRAISGGGLLAKVVVLTEKEIERAFVRQSVKILR